MIEPQFKNDQRHTGWIDAAACLGEDPELFFPVGVSPLAIDQTERAKQVCRGCAVRHECLRWALDSCQDAGVWGGLDEEERRVIRRQRRSQRRAASSAPEERNEALVGTAT